MQEGKANIWTGLHSFHLFPIAGSDLGWDWVAAGKNKHLLGLGFDCVTWRESCSMHLSHRKGLQDNRALRTEARSASSLGPSIIPILPSNGRHHQETQHRCKALSPLFHPKTKIADALVICLWLSGRLHDEKSTLWPFTCKLACQHGPSEPAISVEGSVVIWRNHLQIPQFTKATALVEM